MRNQISGYRPLSVLPKGDLPCNSCGVCGRGTLASRQPCRHRYRYRYRMQALSPLPLCRSQLAEGKRHDVLNPPNPNAPPWGASVVLQRPRPSRDQLKRAKLAECGVSPFFFVLRLWLSFVHLVGAWAVAHGLERAPGSTFLEGEHWGTGLSHRQGSGKPYEPSFSCRIHKLT